MSGLTSLYCISDLASLALSLMSVLFFQSFSDVSIVGVSKGYNNVFKAMILTSRSF